MTQRIPPEVAAQVARLFVEESPSAEHVALTRMQADRCLKVISEMPEMRSRVAYLKFHEGWKNREIAEELRFTI